MNLIEHGHHWIETTTITELQQGVRTFRLGQQATPGSSIEERITTLADELEQDARRETDDRVSTVLAAAAERLRELLA